LDNARSKEFLAINMFLQGSKNETFFIPQGIETENRNKPACAYLSGSLRKLFFLKYQLMIFFSPNNL